MSFTIHSRCSLALAVGLSAASQAQARTRIIHTTNSVCYNAAGQRINCPFHWTPLYIILISIGGFALICGTVWALLTCSRRSNRSREISVVEREKPTSRRWRWPWAKKYQKVSDPEGSTTVPVFAASQEQFHEPVLHEPTPSFTEKLPRRSEDSYYVPPELKYDYKPMASGSTLSLPKPEYTPAPDYEPPPYPPPLP